MSHPVITQEFACQGFTSVPQVLADADCHRILSSLAELAPDSAGSRRLLHEDWCRALVAGVRRHPAIASLVPSDHVAAQCTYFEKSQGRNWLVPIHQDLSIPVAQRVAHADLKGWSEKEGSLFVQPPVDVLEQLVAVRLHLDPCREADGPLQFIAASHTQGRLTTQAIAALRQTHPLTTCVLERGDALVMRPLALHASSKASGISRRRVLHILFGPAKLPYGLRWEN